MSEHEHEQAPLDRAWLPYSDEIVRLAVELRKLDLIDEEIVGKLKPDRPPPL